MRILLLIALLAIANGVVRAQPEKTDDDRLEIIPLGVGNSWTYSVTAHIKRNEIIEVELDVAVSEAIVIAGYVYFRMDGMDSEKALFANGDSGLYAWRDDLSLRQLILRYPARAGDTYVIAGKSEDESVIVDVVAIDVPFDFDGESHLAYRYRLTNLDEDKSIDALVVPGVGIVSFTALDIARRHTTETEGHLVRRRLNEHSRSDAESDVR